MRQLNLTVFVRQDESLRALENAEPSALKTRCMFSGEDSFAARFDSDHTNGFVVEKWMEKSDRVTPASDAGNEDIRQSSLAFQDLAARFVSDYALKIANHHRIRMRAQRGTEDVMGSAHVRHPIAHCFV